MKKIIIRNSIYCSILTIVFFIVTNVLGKKLNFDIQEVLGYVGIVLSLLFVYFGIRQYRDQVNNGLLTFGQGMKTGLLITLVPAVTFGLLDLVYTTYINPGFMDQYYGAQMAKLKASLPAAEFAQKAKELESMKSMFGSPLIQFGVMFITVLMIGIIITVLSALILRRSKPVNL